MDSALAVGDIAANKPTASTTDNSMRFTFVAYLL